MAMDKDLLLVIGSSGLGDGEPDLGEKLMRTFLKVLLESGDLPAKIICMSSGIFLTTQHSPVLGILKGYEEQGAEILSCEPAWTTTDEGRSSRWEIQRTWLKRCTP
jgi:hypothetical protein